jgi:hypothetical protein
MPDTVQDLIRKAAQQYGVPEALALAVAEQESGFNPTLINPKKVKTAAGEEQAVGTFQFLPSTAKLYGIDPMDPRQNIEGGAKYLRDLLDRHEGNLDAVLKEYGGVRSDTTYVPGVLARLRKFQTGAEPPPSGVPPAAAVMPDAIQQSTETFELPTAPPSGGMPGGRFLGELATAGLVEPLTGLAQLASTAVSEGPLAAAKQLGKGVVEPVISGMEKATAARHAGDAKTWVKEIVGAIPIYGPTIQQAGEMALEGDIQGAAGRAIGGLIPIRGTRRAPGRAAAGRALEASAESSMRKLLSAAGDGSKAAERAVDQVLPLALDRSLLRVTRGRFMQQVEQAKRGIGRQIGAEIAGPTGDVIVPVQPVIQGLDDLRQTITNAVPINSLGQPIGATAARRGGPYSLRAVEYNKRLGRQIDTLERTLLEHGPDVQLRQLVNLRRDWDEFVYASRSWLNKDDMVKQYEARAKSAANDAIRGIIDQDPRLTTLADFDKAYSLHSKLYTFIADEAFGRGSGLPYFPGFGLQNAVIRRIMDMALKSPSWRLMSIATRKRLADSLINNNQTVTRRILRGVIGGGTAQVGRQAPPPVESEFESPEQEQP